MKVYCQILRRLVILETNNGKEYRVRIPVLGYRSLYRYGRDAALALARVQISAQIRRHSAPFVCVVV